MPHFLGFTKKKDHINFITEKILKMTSSTNEVIDQSQIAILEKK